MLDEPPGQLQDNEWQARLTPQDPDPDPFKGRQEKLGPLS